MARPKDMNVIRHSDYAEHHDDFPTPPWAMRAFFEYVAPGLVSDARRLTILEPAAGRGHMVGVMKELGFKVKAYDKHDYGVGFKTVDYVGSKQYGHYDLMITNPPFKFSNQFVLRALNEAEIGVGVLLRTIWLDGTTRYNEIFKPNPPTIIATFSRRMQAAMGKVVRSSGGMMSHSWFWWDKTKNNRHTRQMWIPPEARLELEQDEDYLPIGRKRPIVCR